MLRHQPSDFNVSEVIQRFKSDTQSLLGVISGSIIGKSRKNYLASKRLFIKFRLPAALAQELVDKTTLASAFDIIEVKANLGTDIEVVAKLFYTVSERLQLHWIRNAISQTIVRNHWNHLASLNLRNDLHANQRNLTELVLNTVENKRHTGKAMTIWEEQNALALERYDSMLNEFSAMRTVDFPTVSVAVAEVRRLVLLGQREHHQ